MISAMFKSLHTGSISIVLMRCRSHLQIQTLIFVCAPVRTALGVRVVLLICRTWCAIIVWPLCFAGLAYTQPSCVVFWLYAQGCDETPTRLTLFYDCCCSGCYWFCYGWFCVFGVFMLPPDPVTSRALMSFYYAIAATGHSDIYIDWVTSCESKYQRIITKNATRRIVLVPASETAASANSEKWIFVSLETLIYCWCSILNLYEKNLCSQSTVYLCWYPFSLVWACISLHHRLWLCPDRSQRADWCA